MEQGSDMGDYALLDVSIHTMFIHMEFKSISCNPHCKNQGICTLSDAIYCDLSFNWH